MMQTEARTIQNANQVLPARSMQGTRHDPDRSRVQRKYAAQPAKKRWRGLWLNVQRFAETPPAAAQARKVQNVSG